MINPLQRLHLFAIYYSNIVGIRFHPKNDRFPSEDELRLLAAKAMDMVEITEQVCPIPSGDPFGDAHD